MSTAWRVWRCGQAQCSEDTPGCPRADRARKDLRAICIVQGCLSPRVGANMCAPHQQHTTRLGHLRAMEQEQDTTANEADELARRLLLLSALDKRVAAAIADAREGLRRLIRPGTTLKPRLSDGGPAGTMSYTVAGIKAQVADEKALAAWVMTRYPTEVDMPVVVRPAFRARLLEVSEAAGVPLGPGGEAAEDAPPIRMVNTPGVVRATPDKERAAQLWAEIRAGATLFELEEQGQ